MLNDKENVIECSCSKCVNACTRKPGWFIPSEIKPAADLLGMTVEDFFHNYLMVDYYHSDDNSLFVLSPAILGNEAGGMYPFNPAGTCVFLENGKCKIHQAKPYECRNYDHTNSGGASHFDVAKEWKDSQDEIERLLGKKPELMNVVDILLEMLGNNNDNA